MPTCVSMGNWNSGLLRRAVLLGQLRDVGQVGFADQHARAGKLVESNLSAAARISAITACTPGRLLVLRVVQLRVAVGVDERLAVLVLAARLRRASRDPRRAW